MSTEPDPRCPRCGALFTPDQIKRAQPTADCTFCNMTVLLRRTEPIPEAAPLAWPKGFVVTETPAPKPTSADRALVRVGGDPYRDAGSQAPALRPSLLIAWTDDNFYMRIVLVLVNLFLWGTSITAWVLTILGIIVGKADVAIAWTIGAIGAGWFTRMLWRNARRVGADHNGLHWSRVAMSTRIVQEHLPASEIAQLFVRVETPELGEFEEGIPIPAFILYARDHGGRDHVITQVEYPEQAWWLEERLERHLGAVDRPVDGEHKHRELASSVQNTEPSSPTGRDRAGG